MSWRACLALLLVLLSAGCANLAGMGSYTESEVIRDRSQPLGPALEQFSLSGRLVLRQGQRRDHLRFDWDHSADTDILLLTTPLGQGAARLTRDATGAHLNLADGRRFAADELRTLAQKVFGQSLPLDELPHWLRGARPAWQADVDGWHVEVSEATAYPAQEPFHQRRLLPRVLEASSADTSLRLVIDEPNERSEPAHE